MGFVTLFYCEAIDDIISKIFSVVGNGGIECFLSKGALFYRSIPFGSQYTEPGVGIGATFIANLKEKTWYFLGLSHEAPKKFGGSYLSVS